MIRNWIDLFKSRYSPLPPPTMTEAEALQVSRRRWADGSILKGDRQKGEASCLVGWINREMASHPSEAVRWSAFQVRGIGLSWEEAFQDADCKDLIEQRQKQDRRKKRKTVIGHLESI